MRRAIALAVLAIAAFAMADAPSARAAAAPSTTAPNFTLSDQNGKAFTLAAHRGHPIVLFFGYTHCPDVCPTILANLRRAREGIGLSAADLVVALITVDPKRDTARELKAFVSAFDPAFLGLTGTPAQLEPVYRAYHVRSVKGAENASGYLVSHTAFVYYIGRNGHVRGFGTWNDPQDVLEENLRGIR